MCVLKVDHTRVDGTTYSMGMLYTRVQEEQCEGGQKPALRNSEHNL